MKAIVYYKYGAPVDGLKLQDIDKPVIKDDDVLVRVQAASIHAGDWLMMRGQPYIARPAFELLKQKDPVAGTDVAGRVEAVAKNVKWLQPGDEIFGWYKGAFAEYACAGEDQFVRETEAMSNEEAGAHIRKQLLTFEEQRSIWNSK